MVQDILLSMGRLARHLQQRFVGMKVRGWTCEAEVDILSRRDSRRLAYSPKVDLLLRGHDRQIAVELEISRADPVANQAKFVLAYRSGFFGGDDAMVGMYSSHIARGRRELCGAFARQMRSEGLPLFTVALMPSRWPGEIKRLNGLSTRTLAMLDLHVEQEMGRLLDVVKDQVVGGHRIHFAGDVSDVMANLWAWNEQIRKGGQRRTYRYFVQDPRTGMYAPSKFCAFIPARGAGMMHLKLYEKLNESDSRFDGNKAWKHLANRLSFSVQEAGEQFWKWYEGMDEVVGVKKPVKVLVPPGWYGGRAR